MANDQLTIRVMDRSEIPIAGDWAAAEGWNLGLDDAACFATVDPNGFYMVNWTASPLQPFQWDDRFAFLGFYIVRPDLRGRGYGLRTWQAGVAHAGSRVVGLDGVVTRQENYRKSGFVLAHRNIRFGGVPAVPPASPQGLVSLADIPFAAIEADDATVFPAPRPSFLRAWIDARRHFGRALIRDGRLAAWGVIRPCRKGYKIGPLVADDRRGAEAVLAALIASAGGGEVFLDVVEPNRDAVALAQAVGLAPIFETARMYTGAIRPVALSRIFGITTFELG
jgi:Acetyltransferase (GNAT) domain